MGHYEVLNSRGGGWGNFTKAEATGKLIEVLSDHLDGKGRAGSKSVKYKARIRLQRS